MTRRHTPRFAVAILERLMPENDPLIGDLLEESRRRSGVWFWRQASHAALAHAMRRGRANPRLTIEGAMVTTAVLALLGFQAVVAASLVTYLFGPVRLAWVRWPGHAHDWLALSTVSSFVLALSIGRSMGLHRANRVVTVLACGASATAAALFNLWLTVPRTSPEAFLPSASAQTAVATVFMVGLFAGVGWRSLCEPLRSS